MSNVMEYEAEAAPPAARPAARPPVPRAAVDFSRDVVCLLGLPFDHVGTDGASQRVRQAAQKGKRLMVSTANVNFIVTARKNPAFRQSVVGSQLSLADGMPIVWISKLLGMALPERVPGSTLFENLCASQDEPAVKVFFFGAPDGVAEMASHRVNGQKGGVSCVGFYSPGYGSIDDFSSPEVIEYINATNPDFVIVSLGAEKGQAWIERNRHVLRAPVISHLGAVVNMAGGTVKRAPLWFQRTGLEWLWRIKEEPKLWERYANDGVQLARILWNNVLPLCLDRLVPRTWFGKESAAPVGKLTHPGHFEVTFGRHVGREQVPALRAALTAATEAHCAVHLDFSRTRHIDARALGLLLLLQSHLTDQRLPMRLEGVSASLARQLAWHGADYLLTPEAPALGVQGLPGLIQAGPV